MSETPVGAINADELRRILSKYFPQWRVDQILEETCPYCGNHSPQAFKIYKHPKDGDCVGIYTCTCGKRFVRSNGAYAEVW